MRQGVLVLLLFLLAPGISCGGPPGSKAIGEAEMAKMVLPLEAYDSIGSGFREAPSSGLKDNETHVAEHPDPIDEASDIKAFGRQSSYLLQCDAPATRTSSRLLSVASRVVVYASDDQASAALGDEILDLSSNWPRGEVSVAQSDRADDSTTVTWIAAEFSPESRLAITVHAFHRANIVGLVFIIKDDGTTEADQATHLGAVLQERVEAVLQSRG